MAGNKTTTTARGAVQSDVEAIKADVAHLRNDLAELTRALLSAGQESLRDLNHRMQSEVSSRARQVSDAAHDLRDRGADALDDARHRIEERPLTSVIGAFAAGMMLGTVVDRMRRRD